MKNNLTVPVAILGGGPAGLIVAMELGRRNVAALLIEEDLLPPDFPKANATTSRSMEHYRRLGFARQIRERALPAGYPTDITYLTHYSGFELARLSGSSLRPTEWQQAHESRWPTAEPLARVQQMHVESVMREQLSQYPSVDMKLGWKVESVDLQQRPCVIRARHLESGEELTIAADYVVGADGPRSLTRQGLGISYEGMSEQDRDFFGGKMLATYFRAPGFYDTAGSKSWQYWAINQDQRGLICAVGGEDTFVHHTQLKPGQCASDALARTSLMRAMGREFDFDVIGFAEWTAGFALVAEQLADSATDPHSFLVGDAAHLFTPTGGQGYNTAVDDAANLGWKLAARCQGWGGAELLASYQAERQPIARRNTGFARAMAESIGRIKVPDGIEDATPEGDDRRAQLGDALRQHAAAEFDIPGITYGVFYGDSSVVLNDGSSAPPDAYNTYIPSTVPGARAPHIWINETTSVHDLLGPDFTLLRFCAARPAEDEAIAAARACGVPLQVVDLNHDAARRLYQRDRVLIRPDHHVAWRAAAVPGNFMTILKQVTGQA